MNSGLILGAIGIYAIGFILMVITVYGIRKKSKNKLENELTRLESEFLNIKNVHVSAKEEGSMITFLHKVKNGPADKSYGIHVARLAKMPEELLTRADAILSSYESEAKNILKTSDNIQLTMDLGSIEKEKVEKDELREKLKSIDPLHMTPLEAMNTLFELKEISNERF